MTVIAYDGKYLAADRQITDGSVISGYVTKIERWSGGIVATSGRVADGEQFKAFLEGQVRKFKPKKDFSAFFTRDGKLYQQEEDMQPYLAMKKTAIGDGGEGAMLLMQLGLSAEKAVRQISKINVYCGGKTDVVKI